MSEAIIIAIISSVGVVLAAFVTAVFTYISSKKKQSNGSSEISKKITIKQKQKGKGENLQIGIQKIIEGRDKDE